MTASSPDSTIDSAQRWRKRRFGWVILVLGAMIHAGVISGPVWERVRGAAHGRDFASYYYAVQVAADGEDPYDTRGLSRRARKDGTRQGVHPFFYPPPYLLSMAWVLPLELETAYRTWFWMNSLFLLAALLALWRWVPGPWTAAGMGVALSSFSPVWDSHWMGQANVVVLALVAWGLLLAETGTSRGGVLGGGCLVGLACMMKMSPGLLVAWWLVRRRWWAAGAACVSAVLLSLATLPLLGPGAQWRFYTEVLPSFSSGEYHGLSVPITLYGNHSVPNLVVQAVAWAGQPVQAGAMQPMARALSGVLNLGLVLGTLFALRHPADRLAKASGAGCFVVLMLVVPPYTYEHHMSLLLLPLVACMGGLGAGRLSKRWLVGIVPAYGLLAWQLQAVKHLGRGLPEPLDWLLQEGKFGAAVLLGVACLVLARSGETMPLADPCLKSAEGSRSVP